MKRKLLTIAVICVLLITTTLIMSGCLSKRIDEYKDNVHKNDAKAPLEALSGTWDSMPATNLTLRQFLYQLFEGELANFGISDTSMLNKRWFTDSDTFCIYYCEREGGYYGTLVISGGVPAETVTVDTEKPSDWHDISFR